MKFRYSMACILGLTLLLNVASICPVFAQKKQPPQAIPNEDGEAVARKNLLLSRLKTIADGSFTNRAVKGAHIASLAEMMWAVDEPTARLYFSNALEVSDATPTDKEESQRLFRLKQQIIRLIARHDINWAVALAKKLPQDSLPDSFNARIAFDLIGNNSLEDAATFLRRGFQGKMEKEALHYLIVLRKKNETLANQLFLEATVRMGQMEAANCDNIMELGNYIYRSDNPAFADDPDAATMIFLGGVSVLDFSGERSNVPLQLPEAYLAMVAGALERYNPGSEQRPEDQLQRTKCYALAYQLLPKAKTAELAGKFASAKIKLDSGNMSSVLDRSTQKNPPPPPMTVDEQISHLDSLKDLRRRDFICVNLIFGLLWIEIKEADDGKFIKARRLADKIDNNEVRTQIRALIDFKEGLAFIKSGQLQNAETNAEKLTGAKAALLWLAIVLNSDPGQLSRVLDRAEQVARKVEVTDPGRPYFILDVAAIRAKLNFIQGQAVLNDSVKAFNQGPDASLYPVEEVKLPMSPVNGVEPEPRIMRFQLDIPELKHSFRDNLKIFVENDPETTISTTKGFEREPPRSQWLSAIAWVLITSYRTSTQ